MSQIVLTNLNTDETISDIEINTTNSYGVIDTLYHNFNLNH